MRKVCGAPAGRAMRGLAAVAATVLVLSAVAAQGVRADEVTVSQNDLRTGWDQNERALPPSVVGGGHFGQLFSTAVNGQVYAQPLVVGSHVIVATENDWVYGLNSVTGAVAWSVSLGTPWDTSAVCGDLSPDVGVTSTPVYDPATGTVYLVAATVVNSAVQYHLFGVNPRTGVSSSYRATEPPRRPVQAHHLQGISRSPWSGWQCSPTARWRRRTSSARRTMRYWTLKISTSDRAGR
jgi:hypothetical protein